MRYDFSNFTVFLINETEEGCYLSDNKGFIMESEQMLELAREMIRFAKKHKDDIEEMNMQNLQRYNDEILRLREETSQPKKKSKSCVYFFECGGKYKVGVSKDVKRRIKELDRRPFPVTILAVSKPTEYAFEYECFIHEKLQHLKIDGEWYEISPQGVERVKKYIEGIEQQK